MLFSVKHAYIPNVEIYKSNGHWTPSTIIPGTRHSGLTFQHKSVLGTPDISTVSEQTML